MRKKSFHKAFSLLELSMVLIIISVLTVGAMQGTSMIKAARLTNARSFTAKSPVQNMSGLVAWYETSTFKSLKASEMSDSAQTTTWYDISPSSIFAKRNTLTTSASANLLYKIDGINRLPTMQLNGSGSISISSLYQGKFTYGTIFVVFRPLAVPSGQSLVSSVNTTCSISVKASAITLNAGSAVDSSSVTLTVKADHIVAAYLNGAASSVFFNNASTASGTAMNIGTNQIDGIRIGNTFNGMISEVIIFNRILKASERKDVMSYLSKKYSVKVTGL